MRGAHCARTLWKPRPERSRPTAEQYTSDPRLVRHGGQLLTVFSAIEPSLNLNRMNWAALAVNADKRTVALAAPDAPPTPLCPALVEGVTHHEKNWAPFSLGDELYFVRNFAPELELVKVAPPSDRGVASGAA
jgi:hypothetical protein